MMVLAKNYERQYAQLKRKIAALRIKLLYAAKDESTLTNATLLDNLSKELDILYSDGRYFDEIEKKIETIE